MAQAKEDAGGMKVRWPDNHFSCHHPHRLSAFLQVAFDKLTVDNADQRASMAQAKEDAGGMKARWPDYQLMSGPRPNYMPLSPAGCVR